MLIPPRMKLTHLDGQLAYPQGKRSHLSEKPPQLYNQKPSLY